MYTIQIRLHHGYDLIEFIFEDWRKQDAFVNRNPDYLWHSKYHRYGALMDIPRRGLRYICADRRGITFVFRSNAAAADWNAQSVIGVQDKDRVHIKQE